MTVVTSIETLDGLAEGDQIMVRSRQQGSLRWTKDSTGGFSRESAVVGAEFFTGYIADGRLTKVDESPAHPGEWYQANRHDYFHLAKNEAGMLVSLVFVDGVYRQDHEYQIEQFDTTNTRMVRLERMPDRIRENPESVAVILDRYCDMLAVTNNRLAVAQEQLQNKPEAQKAPPQPEAPTMERVRVTVVVHGRSELNEAAARVALLLPRNATADPPPVPWTYEFQYTAIVTPGECACDTVDRQRVEERLPAGTVEWDMEVSCTNSDEASQAELDSDMEPAGLDV